MLESIAIPADASPAILALNNRFAAHLSWLEPDRLVALVDRAFYARQVGSAAAFILAFDERADYDSPNFLWFRERYARFVYVDRVAVAEDARGQGLARHFYNGLIGYALAAGHDVIVCEVNTDPPNPLSDAFHAAFGFTEVGTAAIHGGSKTVRYLALPISPA